MDSQKIVVSFRISRDEKEILERNAKDLGVSTSQLLRIYIRNEKINQALDLFDKNIAFNHQVLLQISRVANNINQIAHNLNIHRQAYMQNNDREQLCAVIDNSLERFDRQATHAKEIFQAFYKIAKNNNDKIKSYYK